MVDMIDEKKYTGTIKALIEELEMRMKSKAVINVASMSTIYDDLVDGVENDTCEIVTIDFARTSSRAEKIDFSFPIHDNYLRLIMSKIEKRTAPLHAFTFYRSGMIYD